MADRRPEDLVRKKTSTYWPILFVLAAAVLLLVIFFPRTDRASVGDDAAQPGTSQEQQQQASAAQGGGGDTATGAMTGSQSNPGGEDLARNVVFQNARVITSPAVNAGSQTVIVEGGVQNNNSVPIRGADVEAVFYGNDGAPIARQQKAIEFLPAEQMSSTQSAQNQEQRFTNIGPNGSAMFRVTFDQLPGDQWNKKAPELRVRTVYTE